MQQPRIEKTHRVVDGFAVPNLPARSFTTKQALWAPAVDQAQMYGPSEPAYEPGHCSVAEREPLKASVRDYGPPRRAGSSLSTAATVQGDSAVEQEKWEAEPSDEDEEMSDEDEDNFEIACAALCPVRKVEAWRDCL
ncbi:hypothetical protein T484DRAFT_1897477 [Baffinella frigidus]|nr:hypothetical protein T484DRAFT_1897477 [Cryptophyta sp. CCMP2293]